MEAGKAGAPHEVEEEGLGGVVGMMGGEEGGIALLAAEGGEPAVAQAAGGILDAEALGGGVVGSVKAGQVERDTKVVGETADKVLVAVTVAQPQAEIAVGYGKRKAGTVHEVCQHGGIDTPTDGQQHPFPSGKEVLPVDVGDE